MLLSIANIQSQVLVRSNRTTTDSFITDAMLNDWVRQAHNWAVNYKKWPFSEGRVSTTWASGVTNEDGYTTFEYPEGITINNHPEDTKNYANLTLTFPNNNQVNIIMADKTSISPTKNKNIIDTTLGGITAQKYVENGQTTPDYRSLHPPDRQALLESESDRSRGARNLRGGRTGSPATLENQWP